MSLSNVHANAAARSSASLAASRERIAYLSDPPARQVDSIVFDLLNAEMLDIVIAAASTAQARQRSRERQVEAQLARQSIPLAKLALDDSEEEPEVRKMDEALVRTRLEGMGYRVGWCLAERLSRDKPPLARQAPVANAPTSIPPPEPLEAVKFVCKDIWTAMYDKQIDNLRTNHRGVYVLQDNAHKPLLRLSGIADDPVSREAWVLRAQRILYMPCGVIRGALACLGIVGVVTAELGGGTQCTFQIRTTQKPAT